MCRCMQGYSTAAWQLKPTDASEAEPIWTSGSVALTDRPTTARVTSYTLQPPAGGALVHEGSGVYNGVWAGEASPAVSTGLGSLDDESEFASDDGLASEQRADGSSYTQAHALAARAGASVRPPQTGSGLPLWQCPHCPRRHASSCCNAHAVSWHLGAARVQAACVVRSPPSSRRLRSRRAPWAMAWASLWCPPMQLCVPM